tara:strand:- start:1512 stop:1874 length:363 start_codon:yes stop_codon:yes gene_type:complete
MTQVPICDVSELPPGERKIVELDGNSIGVFNIEGNYYAASNKCPHAGGPVCTGRVGHELLAEFTGVGLRVKEYFGPNIVLACPWHGWEFNLETGAHLGDSKITLPLYEVTVQDNKIFVEI